MWGGVVTLRTGVLTSLYFSLSFFLVILIWGQESEQGSRSLIGLPYRKIAIPPLDDAAASLVNQVRLQTLSILESIQVLAPSLPRIPRGSPCCQVPCGPPTWPLSQEVQLATYLREGLRVISCPFSPLGHLSAAPSLCPRTLSCVDQER